MISSFPKFGLSMWAQVMTLWLCIGPRQSSTVICVKWCVRYDFHFSFEQMISFLSRQIVFMSISSRVLTSLVLHGADSKTNDSCMKLKNTEMIKCGTFSYVSSLSVCTWLIQWSTDFGMIFLVNLVSCHRLSALWPILTLVSVAWMSVVRAQCLLWYDLHSEPKVYFVVNLASRHDLTVTYVGMFLDECLCYMSEVWCLHCVNSTYFRTWNSLLKILPVPMGMVVIRSNGCLTLLSRVSKLYLTSALSCVFKRWWKYCKMLLKSSPVRPPDPEHIYIASWSILDHEESDVECRARTLFAFIVWGAEW